jgi:hypothetical protein
MEASQITRLDSQKTKEELNKKINTEIIVVFIPMKLTCHHLLLMGKDQLVKVEPARRTKMRIHKSLKKLEVKRSRIKEEQLSRLT